MFSLFFCQDDSPDLLASDVHTAGAGICNDSAVMKLAQEGPGRVEQMLLRGTSEVCSWGKHEKGREVRILFRRACCEGTTLHRARKGTRRMSVPIPSIQADGPLRVQKMALKTLRMKNTLLSPIYPTLSIPPPIPSSRVNPLKPS